MPGRKPHPASLLQLKNDQERLTKEALQARLENEPQPKSFTLRPPLWLDAEAKKEWRRIVKLYAELDVPILSDFDINALAMYCDAVVTYKKAIEKVREQTEVYVTKDNPNKPLINPWLKVARDAASQVKQLGDVLCLDPVSRARAGMGKKSTPKDDPNGELFD
jgi:P27 family predicted phage terminase small subunit